MKLSKIIIGLLLIFIILLFAVFYYVIPYKSFGISDKNINNISITNGNNGDVHSLNNEEFNEIVDIINDMHYCNYPKLINAEGWKYRIDIVYQDGSKVSYCNNGKYTYESATDNQSIRFWCYKSQVAELENYIDKLFS